MEIGPRIREARRRVGFSLAELKERTGIGESSLSEFENGKREPSVSQLAKIAKACHQSLTFMLLDDVPDDEAVLWRERPESGAAVIEAEFKQLSRNYRLLEEWCSEVVEPYLPVTRVDSDRFGYNDAAELARRVRQELNLGSRPAFELLRVLEDDCGIKIFHRDMEPPGTAACLKSVRNGYAIMLNLRNSQPRRNYDLAHELFHLLTWDIFRAHSPASGIDEEKFANAFASQLLMPEDTIRSVVGRYVRHDMLAASDIPEIARQLGVSSEALVWRLHYVYNWGVERSDRTIAFIDRVAMYLPANGGAQDNPPDRLPARYKTLAVKALCLGEVSTGRFAEMMEISRWEAMQYATQEEYAGVEIRLTPA